MMAIFVINYLVIGFGGSFFLGIVLCKIITISLAFSFLKPFLKLKKLSAISGHLSGIMLTLLRVTGKFQSYRFVFLCALAAVLVGGYSM